jgi:hypothetical protein
VSQTRDTSEARFANVEEELGLIGADLGQGGDMSGGPYTSLWSAVGTSLEGNRALNRIITSLEEQAKQVSAKAQQARQGASQASNDVAGMRSSIVALMNSEQNSFLKFEDINTKLLQLASLVGHIQRCRVTLAPQCCLDQVKALKQMVYQWKIIFDRCEGNWMCLLRVSKVRQ